MTPLVNVAKLTHELNANKHHLYVVGYLVQEMGEFTAAVIASGNMDDRFTMEHPEHDIEEGADVVQNVISNAAMITVDGPDVIVGNIFNAMSMIESRADIDPVATSCYNDDNLAMLSMSVAKLTETSMIVAGDIIHKDKEVSIYYDSALVIHNVISILQANRPELSMGDIVAKICDWIDQKNIKWKKVSTVVTD